MTIETTVAAALNTVLSNSWANELPPNPAWPALVFEIDSLPEDTWAVAGSVAYDQHTIRVHSLAKTKSELIALRPIIDAALEAIPGYMRDDERGDAKYEPDPSVYGYFCNHVIRTQRY